MTGAAQGDRPTIATGTPQTGAPSEKKLVRVEPPYYPIVYVRGYAMTAPEREQVFHDGYYGFAVSSVEKRQAPPPQYFAADIFEGLLIRLMKDYNYVDAVNRGLKGRSVDPSRSLWVSRFYDEDFFRESIRSIEDHARDLYKLVCNDIPDRLGKCGVDTSNLKVILLAHSMGGLVCRALIQKLLPENGKDPKDVIHRFVTMGTPHGGIDLGTVPDFLEDRIVTTLNPFDSSIFKKPRMREYLNLQKINPAPGAIKDEDDKYLYDIHSLGAAEAFPVKRCLCIIGSDWKDYGIVRKLTGGFSDGLVKQDRAYVVAGPRPPRDPGDGSRRYDEDHMAFWANVHRAHSGNRGIVNSYESYENIRRFLFGDTMLRLDLEGIEIRTLRENDDIYFYDIDFAISIRGTASYLHRREQDPCENAVRIKLQGEEVAPKKLFLHTGFMDRKLRDDDDPHLHFLLRFRVTEHRIKEGLLWDHEYPGRVIYSEAMEVRIGEDNSVEHRWLSDLDHQEDRGWTRVEPDAAGTFRFPFREAKSFAACLVVQAGEWPNGELTKDRPEASPGGAGPQA